MSKYLSLPIHIIEFWYPEGIEFFIRTWRNLILFLEEDLAVGLMWKLLLVPLFHDASVVGRALSIFFRVFRIIIGLIAFAAASALILLIAGYWFTLPLFAFFDTPPLFSQVLLFGGIGLFILHINAHPHKKVWQTSDYWATSTIKKEKISFNNLLKHREVLDFLLNLELQINLLPQYEIKDIDSVGEKAYKLAKDLGSEYIGPTHLFVAALEQIPNIDNLLLKFDLRIYDFEQALKYLEKRKQTWRMFFIWDDDFTVHHLKGVNRGWLGSPTPTLDLYSEDITKKAATIGFPEIVREGNISKDVVNILSQSSGRNIILVAPAGSGKTSLIKYLGKQIVSGDAPEALATKRLVALDLTKLLSGIKTQGELAERIKGIFEEVAFSQNVIIVIEEIHELGMGEVGSSLNLYSLIEEYLEQDSFQFIGTTEPENYSRVLEKNSSLARIFRKMEMPQASTLETLDILEYRSIEIERKEKIRITFIALKTIIELSQKFVRDRVLPDSAISVLKEVLPSSVNGWVTKDLVKKIISERVKVPVMEIGTAEKGKLLNLEGELHERLIGQEQAVKAVSDALRRAAAGLREEGRPIGSFLFVGPTGVGKTELAKILAITYFKDEKAFVRFDMSEYQNQESIARLIGSSGEGGLLTEAVRNRPYALLLLDEFEKANDKILTLFLQVLEDGRLTDGQGRQINFDNTIIIATSNAGSLDIAKGLQSGKALGQIQQEVSEELLKTFKPELVNRFDEVVIFKPLSQEELQKIVTLKLSILQTQMKEKGYLLEFDQSLIRQLAERGFDPVLGARPLRRLIQDTLEANLSKLILEDKLPKGQAVKIGAEFLV